MTNKKLNLSDLNSVSGGNEENSKAIAQMLKNGELDENHVNQVIRELQAYYDEVNNNSNLSTWDKLGQLNDIQDQINDYQSALFIYNK